MKDLSSADVLIHSELEAQADEIAEALGRDLIDVRWEQALTEDGSGMRLFEFSPKHWPWRKRITMRALVMPDGNAVIARLLLDNS